MDDQQKNKPFNVEEILNQLRAGGQNDINLLFELNLRKMERYYRYLQGLSRRNLLFVMVSALAGFVIIILGIIMAAYLDNSLRGEFSLLSFVLSIVGFIGFEAVSVFSFIAYNKTIRELKDYQNKLFTFQDTLLALKIAGTIDNGEMKNKTLQQLSHILTNKLIKSPDSVRYDYM